MYFFINMSITHYFIYLYNINTTYVMLILASIHCVATPFGSLLSAVLMDRLGRKVTIQFSLIPLILGWILITFALSYPLLLMGRLLAGLSAGLSAAAGQVNIKHC